MRWWRLSCSGGVLSGGNSKKTGSADLSGWSKLGREICSAEEGEWEGSSERGGMPWLGEGPAVVGVVMPRVEVDEARKRGSSRSMADTSMGREALAVLAGRLRISTRGMYLFAQDKTQRRDQISADVKTVRS